MELAKHSIEVERFSGLQVRGLLGREVGRTAKQNASAEHRLQIRIKERMISQTQGRRSRGI
jgi:hypothetical protein